MKSHDDEKQKDALLRAEAEDRLAGASKAERAARPAEDLLHELQVHQIELEMQNEALRQSQVALAESRDRYVDLYEFAPVGYLSLGAEGLIEEINLTGALQLGRERKKLLQTRFAALVVPEDQGRWVQHVVGVKQGDLQGGLSLGLRRGDGSVFQAQLQCVLAKGPFDEQAEGLPVVRIAVSDITARLQVERAVRNERKRMRTILDVAGDPIFVKDNEHRIVLANRAFYDLFELDESAVIGQVLAENRPSDEARHFLDVDRRVLDTGIPYVCEESLTVNHFLRTIVTSKTRFVEDSGEKFLVGTIFDITESKLAAIKHASLEAQLRESQKMEAIGTLAGGIAHDFNNIIAAILGNAELARQDASSNVLVLESVEQIRKAASRARDLVQQILSFSRRQPTELKVIALSPVVEETARLLRATLPARTVLETRCQEGVPLVLGDATQLEQVLINLVTNAAQAMGGQAGHIDIHLDTITAQAMLDQKRTALVKMHARRPGSAVRLTVKDDGPGMDGETLARVFEPFFTTKPVGSGTGLGLSVVHGIVRNHEGVIQVHSELGHGTTFTVILPPADVKTGARTPETSQKTSASVAPVNSGQHILYIDDDGALVSLITRLFKRRGFRVSGHTDQDAALQALRADPGAFDLVLTDYNMPGLSGLDVAREVKAIRRDLPVAVTSGFLDEELLAQAEEAGVQHLIFKADDVEVFCESVLKVWQKAT
ncbi:PAS domain-containing sensor histidine kinase [Hydrogenophaga sp. PAMC20947]|uniref:PAS domain-containing hybrid sensor histidine kinase/response regulator n=1 Tax=Hydrogenophaga sp. PAMC20947 TaxID=2565558 RepID=UPI00109E22F6|nr:PAS domain-containing sensor histidine kinase [Hydrogenophaga sp. PAMC20947]QCB45423.1 PAS domain-containing sensor histidine kinase [Hydrogenophaga sp. PAMC20947]